MAVLGIIWSSACPRTLQHAEWRIQRSIDLFQLVDDPLYPVSQSCEEKLLIIIIIIKHMWRSEIRDQLFIEVVKYRSAAHHDPMCCCVHSKLKNKNKIECMKLFLVAVAGRGRRCCCRGGERTCRASARLKVCWVQCRCCCVCQAGGYKAAAVL